MTSAALGDLDPLIDDAMEEWQVPGIALGVVLDGEPALLKVYGQRDVEAGLPVTINTQFVLCSITKSFTAAGLGMLVDERRLNWTKPVREYIPEFRLHDPIATDRVTVQDLLCHTAVCHGMTGCGCLAISRANRCWLHSGISSPAGTSARAFSTRTSDTRSQEWWPSG
jgi:CubicO group peptidase (beta-lactamase class C family)